ncbi:MAG: CNNM domain-containing protein [Bacteroidota bacterium]
MGILIIYAVAAITFSFFCSIWEAVLLSMPDSYVEAQAATGSTNGLLLKKTKQEKDRHISAILSLNTVAHTVGAILVGKQAETVYGAQGIDILGISFSFTGIVAALMTLGVLLLSEIIPKTLGSNNWKGLAVFTAKCLRVVTLLMTPLVWMSDFITKKMKGRGHGPAISREEISAMAQIGSRDGVFEMGESEIINNLMRFHLIETRSILTPRTVVKAADQEISISAFHEANPNLVFSRIPVYEGSIDNITGFILKDTLLDSIIKQKGDLPLKEIARPITVVKEEQTIQSVFNHFLKEKEQIALVIGQFGGMTGIITFEDVIETLLGLEIVDELDNTEDMQALARQKWERRARQMGLLDDEAKEE